VRALAAALAVVLVESILFGGCGVSERTHARLPGASAGYVVGDADEDDPNPVRHAADEDDVEVRAWGRAGTTADALAMTPVLQRYYAATAAGDGAVTCEQLDRRLAAGVGLEASLPAKYRPAAGSSVFEGKSCGQVEALLSEWNRPQLRRQSASLVVVGVRMGRQGHALAVMRFRGVGERWIAMVREGGAWRVGALIDLPLV
jgi:hypothetical protein